MAEEQILTARVVGDWTEFDRQAQARERTFSTEGMRMPVAGPVGAMDPSLAGQSSPVWGTSPTNPLPVIGGQRSLNYLTATSLGAAYGGLRSMGIAQFSWHGPDLAEMQQLEMLNQVGRAMNRIMSFSGMRRIWNDPATAGLQMLGIHGGQSVPGSFFGGQFDAGGFYAPLGVGSQNLPPLSLVLGRGRVDRYKAQGWADPYAATKYVYAHEFGHHLDMSGAVPWLSGHMSSMYGALSKEERTRMVGEYGASHPLEFFAESFAQFIAPQHARGGFRYSTPAQLPPSIQNLFQGQFGQPPGGAAAEPAIVINSAVSALRDLQQAATSAADTMRALGGSGGLQLPAPGMASFRVARGRAISGEQVVETAVRHRPSGRVAVGSHHGEALENLFFAMGHDDPLEAMASVRRWGDFQDLFTSSRGRLLTRNQAARMGGGVSPDFGQLGGQSYLPVVYNPPPGMATSSLGRPPIGGGAGGGMPPGGTPGGTGGGGRGRPALPYTPTNTMIPVSGGGGDRMGGGGGDDFFEGEVVGGGRGGALPPGGGGPPANIGGFPESPWGGGPVGINMSQVVIPGQGPPIGPGWFGGPPGTPPYGPGFFGNMPPRVPFGTRLSNALRSIPRGVFFNAFFGLWEVGQAHRAVQEANLQAAFARDPIQLMQARQAAVEGASRGPLGSIITLAMDVADTVTGGNLFYSPQDVRADTASEIYRMQSFQSSGTMGMARRADIAVQRAFATGGMTGMEFEQIRQNRVQSEAPLIARQAFLRQQMNERVSITDIPHFLFRPDRFWSMIFKDVTGQDVPYAMSDTARAAAATEIGGLAQEVQRGRDNEEFLKKQQAINTNLAKYGLQERLDVANAAMPWTTVRQQAVNVMKSRHQVEMQQMLVQNPQLAADLARVQNAEVAQLMYEQDLNYRVQEQGVTTELDVNRLTAARRPFEAQLAGVRGRANQEWIAAERDPEERIRINRRLTSRLATMTALEQHERSVMTNYLDKTVESIDLGIHNLPLQSARAALQAERDRTIANIPLDRPDVISSTQRYFAARDRALGHEWREQRYIQTAQLELAEEVTGLLARAYGPGGRLRRRQAELTQIRGQAELRAEQRLLNDATDIDNADRERRIGVNQLRAYRANYLEGFQAQEGSLFRTALTGAGATDPHQVLKSIDDHIQELKNKIGTLVAVP